MRALLEHGADVNAVDTGNRTPLHDATESYVDIVQLLLECGADVNAKDTEDGTPLHMLHGTGAHCVQILLSRGANVNEMDDGRTPLHVRRADCAGH